MLSFQWKHPLLRLTEPNKFTEQINVCLFVFMLLWLCCPKASAKSTEPICLENLSYERYASRLLTFTQRLYFRTE